MLPELHVQLADEILSKKLETNHITILKTAIEKYYDGSFLMCKEIVVNAIYPYRERKLFSRYSYQVVKEILLNTKLYPIASMLEELKLLKDEVENNLAFLPTDYEVYLAKSYAHEIINSLKEIDENLLKDIKSAYITLRKIKET